MMPSTECLSDEEKISYYLSHVKKPVLLFIGFPFSEIKKFESHAKVIYLIGDLKEKKSCKKISAFSSMDDFINNFTSLDAKITHIFAYYIGWDQIKNQLPPKFTLNNSKLYLFIKVPFEKWKSFIDKDRYLIENTLSDYNLKFDDIISSNKENYFYGVFAKVKG